MQVNTNKTLSERVLNMEESATLLMAKKSRELKAQGKNIITLSLGEPDFSPPKHIQQAAIDAINANQYNSYPPVSGYEALRVAICNKLKRENDLNYSPNQIIVTNGVKHALINIIMALINEGDEVIIPTPYWVTYSEQVTFAGGKNIFVNTTLENNFKITPEQLENAISSKTKLFMFSSPCNPTGAVYSKHELRLLADVFKKYPHVYIASDEIYEHINYVNKHESIAWFKDIFDQVIVLNGFSKAFAMPGWRVGYLAANDEISKACEKIQGQMTSGVASIMQMGALAALSTKSNDVEEMKNIFLRRRNIAYDILTTIPKIELALPDGAFYLFLKVSDYFNDKITNADDLSLDILDSMNIAVVSGKSFGAPEYIRLSYATSEDLLVEGLNRLKEYFLKL
ncbi:MAG: pyridoxal phosphate-dependent aminotransferase [Solitalea-like symbiont of Tyrophagus putrescentiae]